MRRAAAAVVEGPDTARARERAASAAARLALAAVFEREALRLSAEVEAWRRDGTPVRPRALVVDGESLLHALEAEALEKAAAAGAPRDVPRCRAALLQLARHCKAVVGCRVSPVQKRQMVELIRFDGAHASAGPHPRAARTRGTASCGGRGGGGGRRTRARRAAAGRRGTDAGHRRRRQRRAHDPGRARRRWDLGPGRHAGCQQGGKG